MNEEIIKQARVQFGLLFKDLRKKKGLSQTEVANFCGVSFQTINKVEQGKFPYSVDLLMKLSVILEFTINFEPKTATESRFILQKSSHFDNVSVVTDTLHHIVCSFENGSFNDTQKFTFLNDTVSHSPGQLASIMRQLGDWLAENHPDLL